MNSSRGFTLIELLVTIAIIGILSAVVLAALSSARVKGADAAIKSNLVGPREQAELYFYANGNSYLGVCGSASINGVKSIYSQVLAAAQASGLTTFAANAAGSASTATCNATATAWAAEVPLKSVTSMFCVDSTGAATTTANSTLTAIGDVSCGP